jgi:hypothetical protein
MGIPLQTGKSMDPLEPPIHKKYDYPSKKYTVILKRLLSLTSKSPQNTPPTYQM